MNEFQLKLTSTQLSKLNSDTAVDLLNELFDRGSKNYDSLAYEIQREFKAGGSPQVTQMHFDRVGFNLDTGMGKFRVLLDINFTFGCEDVKTEKEDQTSEWTFSLDKNSGTITFNSSPFAENRSTADEF
ncbi:hypothetical protein [Mucilaginibacter sp.]